MPEAITETQFLNRIDEPPSSEALDLVRLLRTALSDLSPLKIAPEFILPSLRVESDLGVHHLDSLNLLDLAAFIELDNFSIGSEDLQRLADLNNRDGTVKELALIILNAFRNSNKKHGHNKTLHPTAGNAPVQIRASLPAVDELDVRGRNFRIHNMEDKIEKPIIIETSLLADDLQGKSIAFECRTNEWHEVWENAFLRVHTYCGQITSIEVVRNCQLHQESFYLRQNEVDSLRPTDGDGDGFWCIVDERKRT